MTILLSFPAQSETAPRFPSRHGPGDCCFLGRESLYKALSPNVNPELATVMKVMEALGLRLHAKAV